MRRCPPTHHVGTRPRQTPTVSRRKSLHRTSSKSDLLKLSNRLSNLLFLSQLFSICRFARDSSKFWYKPTLSREETINLLRNAAPGTFLVRDSTTFANAFGLVVKVAQAPIGSKNPNGGDELVRHFLVEPTVRGVRLKGCSNEPVFSSLSALIYQHSVTPLALPCRLLIPDRVSVSLTFFWSHS